MCTPVTPAVPYLLLDLQDVQWAVGNSRGARKLTRTPHVNKNKKTKKKEYTIEKLIIYFLKYFKIIFFYFKKIIFNINIKKIHYLNSIRTLSPIYPEYKIVQRKNITP
jgi:hypothetical protein